MNLVILWLVVGILNYVWAFLVTGNYDTAADRTLHQWILVVVYISYADYKINRKGF